MSDRTTRRPWKYPFGGGIATAWGGIYDKVTVVSGEMTPDDAALIVEAVNAYDRLRAIEAAARNLSDRRTFDSDGYWVSQKEMKALDEALGLPRRPERGTGGDRGPG